MEKILAFIKKCGIYYIATCDKDQPRNRLFSTINMYNNRLYIMTGKSKQFYKEISKNPKTELICWDGVTWLRLSGELVSDDSHDAVSSMLDNYPEFKTRYNGGTDDVALLYFKNAVSEFTSYKHPENNDIIRF